LGHLGQYLSGHLFISRHFVKQVLSLGQHQIAQHRQTFIREIWRAFAWLELRNVLLQVLEDPGSLLHVLAGVLDTVTLKAHEACGSSKADTVVVLGAQSVEDGVEGLDSLATERVVPHELLVHLLGSVSEAEVPVEQHCVLVASCEKFCELLELLYVGVVGLSIGELFSDALDFLDAWLQGSP
jgi:hypothetical protein